MAYKLPLATGAWSAAGTWGTTTNTPTLHASTNITVSAGGIYSAAFTAPSLTDAATGVMVYISAVGSAGSIIATLQEYNGAAWVDTAATATLTITDLSVAQWVLFWFGASYTFTTTTANYYRIKLNTSGAAGTTSVGADSGAANFAYLAQDNRTGVPAATDYVWILGQNISTAVTVTMDGTQSIGNTGGQSWTHRVLTASVNINKGGTLSFDTAASSSLTCIGGIVLGNGGELNIGTVATPMPAAYTGKLYFACTTNGYGIYMVGAIDAKIIFQGASKTFYKTTYSSGAGTTANPLITADAVDWAVNDEITVNIPSSGSYEVKFIKVKNSATSYTLSNTAGGAESGLSGTYSANSPIYNFERNVRIESNSAVYGLGIWNNSTVAGNFNLDWVRFKGVGYDTSDSSVANRGIMISPYGAVNKRASLDYCAFTNQCGYGHFIYCHSKKLADTYTHNITHVSPAWSQVQIENSSNQVFSDLYIVGGPVFSTGAIIILGSSAITLTNVRVIHTTTAGVGGFRIGNSANITLNSCEVHAGVIGLSSTNAAKIYLNNCLFGTKRINTTADFSPVADVFTEIICNNTNAASTTPVLAYTSMAAGSKIAFQKQGQTQNNHIWYTDKGTARSSGAGLADTNVRTAGSLGVRIAPENATNGFTWEFNIYVQANSIANFFGYFQKNAAFSTDVARVELWLPGSTSADDTFTLADNTNWQACSLSANYTGSVDLLATIKVVGITATASAYLYADDFYNAGDTITSTDKVTGLDTWDDGMPVTIISPQQVSAADIWTFSTDDLTVADTTGKKLKDINPMIDI